MIPSVSDSNLKPAERFIVGRKIVCHPADLAQITVFGTDRSVIEPGGNGMGQLDLAIFVREQKGSRSLKNSEPSSLESCCMFAGANSFAARFDPDHPHARIIQKRME